jgi:hypothetical protein
MLKTIINKQTKTNTEYLTIKKGVDEQHKSISLISIEVAGEGKGIEFSIYNINYILYIEKYL